MIEGATPDTATFPENRYTDSILGSDYACGVRLLSLSKWMFPVRCLRLNFGRKLVSFLKFIEWGLGANYFCFLVKASEGADAF